MRIKFLKKIFIKQEYIIDYFLLIVYKITLDIVYLYAVSPVYEYAGMVYNPVFYKYLISTIIFVLFLKPVIHLYRIDSTSATIILLLNLFYFVPGCTFYAFSGISDYYFLFFSLYWMLLMFWFYYLPATKFKRVNSESSQTLFITVSVLIILSSLIITGLYNGFKLHLSLADVYKLRFAQREMNLPAIVRYLQPIASTLAPIIMIYCFIEKKRIWGIVLIFVQLLLFSFGGMKSTLLLLIFALLAYFFYRKERVKWLISIFIFLNVFAIAEIFFRNVSYVSSLIIYRVNFIPNLLSYQYYDYFKEHELLYWRESFLRHFGLESPYILPIPNLIGKEYYSDIKNYANNGLCGDAFSNFGWISLIILPFIIVILCKIIDACTARLDCRIILIVALIFSSGFINSSYFGLLLTNGFIFAGILLYFLPRTNTV
jgi:hypothetical protein